MEEGNRRVSRHFRPCLIVLVLSLAYVGLTLARHDGDPLAFALVGTRYSQDGAIAPDSQGTPGYDGQFAYFIARNPVAGWRYCDVPAYRYQRILYPLLSWAVALGQADVVPWTLILVNLAAVASGTYFTERLLASHGASRWYALGYGLYGGVVAGLRLDLNEPLAYALVQGGLWAWADKRISLAAAMLALAGLTKETTLIAVGGLGLYLLLEGRWRELHVLGLGVAVPFAAWQGALWVWLGRPGVGTGGAMATPFELIPFAGLARAARVSWPAFWLLLAVEGPLFVLPAVWACLRGAGDLFRGHRHPWTAILVAQAAVLPFLPFSTWREPLAMARLATGLVSATLLYGALRRTRRLLNLSLAWLSTLALLINESQLPV
jgi:hypothetical protein